NGAVASIDKFRVKYRTPGLLQQFLFAGLQKAPALPPSVSITLIERNTYRVTVSAAPSGGIGPVEVYLNNRLIYEDARSLAAKDPRSVADAPSVIFTVDPARLSTDPSKENDMRVVAYDKGKNISSEQKKVMPATAIKGTGRQDVATPQARRQPPGLWSLVIGVSSYDYPELNLRFPARDAEAMATALQVGGRTLFQPERTHTIKL